MSHTDTPLILEDKQFEIEYRYITTLVRGIPTDVARLALMGDTRDIEINATAKRLTQCYNACHDLPTEALDIGWTARIVHEHMMTLESQRNTLLGTVQRLVKSFEAGDKEEMKDAVNHCKDLSERIGAGGSHVVH